MSSSIANAEWKSSCDVDDFDDTERCWAESDIVPVPGPFPYRSREAILRSFHVCWEILGAESLSQTLYVDFINGLHMRGGQIKQGYREYALRTRIDKGEIISRKVFARFGMNSVHFIDKHSLIADLGEGDVFAIQFPMIQRRKLSQ